MRRAGALTAQARSLAMQMVEPGVTTREIDREVRHFITKAGAKPSFLGYGGFPGSACISVNDQVIHGIPGKRMIQNGDIVSLDLGACVDGYHGDCAATVACGEVTEEAKRLIEVTRASFFEGIKFARQGYRVSDISHAIQEYVESHGFSIVREYVGHGIGASLHEAPEVPNYGTAGRGVRLMPGMTLAIEPMINQGTHEVRVLADKWTVVTKDAKLSAHYEHSVAVTNNGVILLTKID